MTAFEYFSVMVSVILGLGVTQLLTGIGQLLQRRGDVELYWVYSLWVLLLLALHFAVWWNIWALRDTPQFNYLSFLYLLLGPALLFLAARVMMPLISARDRIDLEHHYYTVRRSFFTLLILFAIWPALIDPLLMNRPVSLGQHLIELLVMSPIFLGLIASNRRLHAVIAIYVAVAFVGLNLVAIF